MFEKSHKANTGLRVLTRDGVYSNGNRDRANLTVSWESEGTRTAVAIGINPSKANDTRSDKTLTTLARFLDTYGFSQFTMLNIFQTYSTNQDGINRLSRTDFSRYQDVLESADAIFIVWGVSAAYSQEKEEILQILREYQDKLFCIEGTNKRSPLHPSRMSYECTIAPYIRPES